MTYHENPIDIPVGTDVALTYTGTGNTYTGTVASPGVMADTSGRIRSIIIEGDRVEVLGDAEVDLTAQQKRDRDHAEIVLADFKRSVSEVIVRLGEEYTFDDDVVDNAHDELGIDRPKAEPIDVEVTVKVTARLTPTSRTVARDVGLGSFLEDSVIGLDLIDFDADSFEVDLYHGVNAEVTDWDVTN